MDKETIGEGRNLTNTLDEKAEDGFQWWLPTPDLIVFTFKSADSLGLGAGHLATATARP